MVITLNNEKENNSRTSHDRFGNTKFTEKIVDFDDFLLGNPHVLESRKAAQDRSS